MATLRDTQVEECSILSSEPPSGPERRPESVSELDVRQSVLEDLLLKIVYLCGSLSILELCDRLRLSFTVTNQLLERLRADSLCIVTGMSGNIAQIAITSQGRVRAAELQALNQYSGNAPVSLESYVKQVRKQSVKKVEVRAVHVKRAFAHLVIDKEMLNQFGTALNSGSSILLYGPAGVGKTTMAEILSRVIAEDDVWIPYAVEVDGQIITVYDPAIHKRVREKEPGNHDLRWVLCQRPAVLVGGELTTDMLDLQFNPVSKFYTGPVQLKANNGVLIIDDFGRQRMRPDELLNRWIVPLDRRIDFLSLIGGKKIEIPFEMLVVFASNLDPEKLVDPAFLRRIQTKIRIGEVSNEQFCEIFCRVTSDMQVPFDAEIPNDLIDYIHNTLGQELRSCYPRDILNQVCWAARYENKRPYLDKAALMKAIDAYFPRKTQGTQSEQYLMPAVTEGPASQQLN
jgi:energy-coupling factor transporter ATP-binding protein EcfA2